MAITGLKVIILWCVFFPREEPHSGLFMYPFIFHKSLFVILISLYWLVNLFVSVHLLPWTENMFGFC